MAYVGGSFLSVFPSLSAGYSHTLRFDLSVPLCPKQSKPNECAVSRSDLFLFFYEVKNGRDGNQIPRLGSHFSS